MFSFGPLSTLSAFSSSFRSDSRFVAGSDGIRRKRLEEQVSLLLSVRGSALQETLECRWRNAICPIRYQSELVILRSFLLSRNLGGCFVCLWSSFSFRRLDYNHALNCHQHFAFRLVVLRWLRLRVICLCWCRHCVLTDSGL